MGSHASSIQHKTNRAEKSAERPHDAHEPEPTKLGCWGNSRGNAVQQEAGKWKPKFPISVIESNISGANFKCRLDRGNFEGCLGYVASSGIVVIPMSSQKNSIQASPI